MAYLLDANVFIEAKNRYYGLDFCPAFWDWLIFSNKRGIVFSIEKVREELKSGNDDLVQWALAREQDFFLSPDQAVTKALHRVTEWVFRQKYEPAAINTFLEGGADYFLVAHALAHNFVIVTHEKEANTVKKVKIPNVCIGLNIGYMDPFEMLRHEGARFVLEGAASR